MFKLILFISLFFALDLFAQQSSANRTLKAKTILSVNDGLELKGTTTAKIQTYNTGAWQDRLTILNDGKVGIGKTPTVALDVSGDIFTNGKVGISATDAILIPVGTTAQAISTTKGAIRYNNDNSRFEGYGTSWTALGGAATGTVAGIVKKTRYQTKYVASNITTPGGPTTVTALSYTLVAGTTYRIKIMMYGLAVLDSSTNYCLLEAVDGSTALGSSRLFISNTNQIQTNNLDIIHTMVGTALTFQYSIGDAATIVGDGTNAATHVTVEELNGYEATTAW